MTLAFELDWVIHIALPNVHGPHPLAEGLNKKVDLLTSERNLLMNDCFSWNFFFPAFEFQVKHWLFMGLEPADLELELMPSAPLSLWLAIWNMSTSTLCVYIIFTIVSKCSSYKWNNTAIELAAAKIKLFKCQNQEIWNLDLSLEAQYCTILYLIKKIKHIFMMFEFEWDFR